MTNHETTKAYGLADRIGARAFHRASNQYVTVRSVEYRQIGLREQDWTVLVNGWLAFPFRQSVPFYFPGA